MSYVTLYRKFRPKRFSDVKGQDHVVTTLKNQILSDRVGHAYLFTGTRGTGKTSVAKIMARAVNCENPEDGEPCGECELCRAALAGNSMNVIEIDAASNTSIEDIKEIIDEVKYAPTRGKYKVYIIDEIHMLSTKAFNALLKTLEEPPSYVIFILATTDVQQLPITILSRCQRYDFRRISAETIKNNLVDLMNQEGALADEKALSYIARLGDGSMRDALSLLEQCISVSLGGALTYEGVLSCLGAVDTSIFSRMLQAVSEGDTLSCIKLLDKIVYEGKDPAQFVSDFISYLRNVMLIKVAGTDNQDVFGLSEENLNDLKETAKDVSLDSVMRYITVLSDLAPTLKYTASKQTMVEIALIRLTKPQMDSDFTALKERIAVLENKLEKGDFVSRQAAAVTSAIDGPKAAPRLKDMPIAVAKEVKQVADEYQSYVAMIESPATRMHLKNAKACTNESGKLILAAPSAFAEQSIRDNGGLEELKSVIAERLGKQVEIDLQSYNGEADFNDRFVEISENINISILIEE